MRYVVCLLVLALAVAAAVYGNADDSPGLVLLALIAAVAAVACAVWPQLRRRRNHMDS